MADPITKLRFQTENGDMAELDVYEGDTPEKLAEILRKNGLDPSKYTKELNEAVSGGQGYDEVANIGSDPASQKFSARGKQLYEYLQTIDPSTKEGAKLADQVMKQIELEMKLGKPAKITEAELKEKAKQNIGKDIVNIFKILPEIETYKGWKSLPAYGGQAFGSLIGENPEYSQYKNKVENLKIPVVKQIKGDSGQVSDIQEKKAAEFFPSGASMLFEQKGRPRALVNLFESAEAGTGLKLTDMLTREEIERAGGPDPEKYLEKFLDKIYGAKPDIYEILQKKAKSIVGGPQKAIENQNDDYIDLSKY